MDMGEHERIFKKCTKIDRFPPTKNKEELDAPQDVMLTAHKANMSNSYRRASISATEEVFMTPTGIWTHSSFTDSGKTPNLKKKEQCKSSSIEFSMKIGGIEHCITNIFEMENRNVHVGMKKLIEEARGKLKKMKKA